MIMDLRKIDRGGYYIGDFRYDEGIRIREEPISPTLRAGHDGHSPANSILLVIVDENKKRNE